MPSENVTTKFKVDISDLKKNIKTANQEIKLYNAEIKNASAGMKKGEESADSLTKKIDAQSKIVDAEKTKLDALREQLARYNDKMRENEKTIAALTQKQEQARKEYGDDSEEVKKLTKQLDGARAEQERNADATQRLTTQIINQDSAVKNAEGRVRDFTNQLQNLDNATDETDEELKDTTEGGLNAFGIALGNLAADVIEKTIEKLGELANAAKEAFLEFDEGRDAVIKATGATGEDAQTLTKNYSNVAKTVGTDFATVGKTLGEVSTRFGVTGDTLEQTTTDFLHFANITGTDAVQAVQLVSRAMGDAGIDVSDYKILLDELTIAQQNSGISISKLTELLTSYGAPMRALGFDTESAIAIFSQWEKAGVNTQTAFSGMKTAISAWSADGKDAREEFKKTVAEIAAMPDIANATTKSIEVFGKRAGPDLADAIQGGRFNYEEFLTLIENSSGTLDNTFAETSNAVDKYNVKLNALKATAGEIITNLLEKYEPQINDFFVKLDGWIENLQPTIEKIIGWLETNLPVIETELSAIIAAVVAFKAVTIIQGIIGALTGLVAVIKAVGVQQAITNAIMAANPIGLIVAAIAALIAILVVAYHKVDWFRSFVDNVIVKGWKDFAQWWTDVVTKKLPEAAKRFVTWFKSGWAQFAQWWTGKVKDIWTTIKNVFLNAPVFFTDLWKKIKNGFVSIGTKIGDAIGGAFKTAINAVLETVENNINFLPRAINGAIDLINALPGVSIPTMPEFSLPRLARGGIVDKSTIAQIGEHGKEAIIPLENNKRGLREIASLISDDMSGAKSVVYNFNQTNNSPKALSRYEIYRQTKNLINASKAV